MFSELFWTAPKVVMLIRFLGWFGGLFGLISLFLLLLKREHLLGVGLILCFSTGVAVAAYQERLSTLINREQFMVQYESIRDRWSSEDPVLAGPEPTKIPPEATPSPQPSVLADGKDSTEGLLSIPNVFAGRNSDLIRKSIGRIFDGLFGGNRPRYDNLAAVHKQAILDGFKPLLIVKVKEESSLGQLGDVYFDPDSVKNWLIQQGYVFDKVRIEFLVKENFTAGVDEEMLGDLLTTQIQQHSKYYLGDGFYTEEHRLLSELKNMEFQTPDGVVFHTAVLNPNPHFDPTRDIQTLELRVF